LRSVSLQAIVDEDVGRLGTIARALNQTFQRLPDLVIWLQHLAVRRKLSHSFFIWPTLAQKGERHREIGGKHFWKLHLLGHVRHSGPGIEHVRYAAIAQTGEVLRGKELLIADFNGVAEIGG
jgi:hypothetical protein